MSLYTVRTPSQGINVTTHCPEDAASLYNAHRGPLSVPVTADLLDDRDYSPVGSVWQAANGLRLEVLA